MGRNEVARVAALAVVVALAGCTAPDSASGSQERPEMSTWESFAGPWTLEQIVEFPSELRVVGTIASIDETRTVKVSGAGTLDWVAVSIDVETSTPDLGTKSFVARVIPAFESQAEIDRLRVGDRVLYLGDLPVEADGVNAGTSSWIIKIAPNGSLVATNELDAVDGGTLAEVAEELRLDTQALGLATSPTED